MNPDGNLVVYPGDGSGQPIWQSNTGDHDGAHLEVRDEDGHGALLIVAADGSVLWRQPPRASPPPTDGPAVDTTGSVVTPATTAGCTVSVPTLIGKTESDARALLQQAGLVAQPKPDTTDARFRYVVSTQSADPGALACAGDTIPYTLALAAPTLDFSRTGPNAAATLAICATGQFTLSLHYDGVNVASVVLTVTSNVAQGPVSAPQPALAADSSGSSGASFSVTLNCSKSANTSYTLTLTGTGSGGAKVTRQVPGTVSPQSQLTQVGTTAKP
jgi:hypothetical protein